MVDKIGFQWGYTSTTVLQALLMLSLPFTVGSKVFASGTRKPAGCMPEGEISQPRVLGSHTQQLAFAFAVCATLFCLGGSIAMFVTANAQMFGLANAGEIYSLLFSAFALASVTGAKLTMRLVATVGWGGIFKVLATMLAVAVGLLSLLRVETSSKAPWE